MSEALLLEFGGATIEQYNAVNTALGVDPVTGEGDWPAGLISHMGAPRSNGAHVVVEVWDSQASQVAFMSSRLGPALGGAGASDPTRVEWFSVVGHHIH